MEFISSSYKGNYGSRSTKGQCQPRIKVNPGFKVNQGSLSTKDQGQKMITVNQGTRSTKEQGTRSTKEQGQPRKKVNLGTRSTKEQGQPRIEQKVMTFDHDFCYLFSFSSSLFILGGRRKGEENNQSRNQKSCHSARSQPRNKVNQEIRLIYSNLNSFKVYNIHIKLCSIHYSCE